MSDERHPLPAEIIYAGRLTTIFARKVGQGTERPVDRKRRLFNHVNSPRNLSTI
jgi:hypothetical protein